MVDETLVSCRHMMDDLQSKKSDRENLVYVTLCFHLPLFGAMLCPNSSCTHPIVLVCCHVLAMTCRLSFACSQACNAEELEDVIRTKLKEIMMTVDLEEVTCKYVSQQPNNTCRSPFNICNASY